MLVVATTSGSAAAVYSRLYTALPKLEFSWSKRAANASPCEEKKNISLRREFLRLARFSKAAEAYVVETAGDVLDRAGELATGERGRHLAVELAEEVLGHAVQDDESLPVLRAGIREIVSQTNGYQED